MENKLIKGALIILATILASILLVMMTGARIHN